MLGFSAADGFMNVKEGVDEMIKYVANEPSVGLFYVQQHAHSSMPYLLNIRDKIVEKVHEVTLHTEDTEDSIYVIRLMTECGLPIAEQMIKDISKSLHIMAASQPKRGLITPATSYYSPFGSQQDGGSSQGYLSSVLSSAKQKTAAGLKWPKAKQFIPSTTPSPSQVNIEADELPVSSSLVNENSDLINAVEHLENQDVSLLLESFDKFRFDREAKLEEWLRDEEQPKEGDKCEARD